MPFGFERVSCSPFSAPLFHKKMNQNHVSLLGSPNPSGSSTRRVVYAVDVTVILTENDYTRQQASNQWQAILNLIQLLAEEAAAVINNSFGSAEVVTGQWDPKSETQWKECHVSSETELSTVRDFVDNLLSAAEAEVQGEEGEQYYETALSNISEERVIDTTVDFWPPDALNPNGGFFYQYEIPFLVFESVVDDTSEGKDPPQAQGPKLNSPYPCRIAPNGDVLVETPNERGIMPEVANGGARTIVDVVEKVNGASQASRATTMDSPSPGLGPAPTPVDPGDPDPGDPDPTPPGTPGPDIPEPTSVRSRIASVQEMQSGYRLVMCEDLSAYATSAESILFATITFKNIGTSGCPDEGGSGGDNGGDNGSDNGGNNGGGDGGGGTEASVGSLALLGLGAAAAAAYFTGD